MARQHLTRPPGGGGDDDDVPLVPGEIIRWPHPACVDEPTFLLACTATAGRSGGPGGQNRNKVSTKITLLHNLTGLEAHASERRSLQENRHVAAKRLRLVLATKHRCPVQKGRGLAVLDLPGGSRLWRSRNAAGKLQCNPDHWDYASLLAEAMDVLADCNWEPRPAALMQDVTVTQFVRLIGEHPPALLLANAERKSRGLHALKA